MEEFRTIAQNSNAIQMEKKSKFIADLIYVETLQDINKVFIEVRKQYPNARHYCYAYRIYQQNTMLEKCSDDGEPSGTAGTPILNVLQKEEIANSILIVTRYFGGILLGTGGLVRAYTQTAKQAVEKAEKIIKELGYEARIIVEYKDQNQFLYYCQTHKIKVVKQEYSEFVSFIVEISQKEYKKINSENLQITYKILTKEIIKTKYIEKYTYMP